MQFPRMPLTTVLLLSSACLLAACAEAPEPADRDASEERASSAATPALMQGIHRWTTPDGNTIPYVVGGNPRATTTVVFVHCWMCDRHFFDEQLPALADGYRTIALDLPGHGEATATREVWSVAQYGDDVAGLLHELDLDDVILVGHSMGGPVALRTAALTEDRVLGIVAVDTLHDASFRFEDEAAEALARAFTANFVASCERMVDSMVPEEGADAVLAQIKATACVPQKGPIGSALMRDFATIDMERWFREAGVPIRAINAAEGRPTAIETNRRLAEFDAVLIEDVGHYLNMTRPDEFNPRLLAAVRELAGDG